MSSEALDATLVVAARDGAPDAVEELVGRYLPLVYNIVGRSLSQRADIDDVVQETMLRVVRRLSGLRDEHAFRSWLVAVTMSQVRQYRQSHRTPTSALGEAMDLPDPSADFESLTLIQLGLSGQRRETAEATRWMDEDYRELLSLWWLVAAGHLTHSELVQAIELDAHRVSVRVSRMKEQLDTARMVVRALAANPLCAELSSAASAWDGRPSGLWRKRLARHVRECVSCGALSRDLIPPERLLEGLSLVAVPAGFTAHILASSTGYEAMSANAAMPPSGGAHRRHGFPKHRAGGSFASLASKPVLTVGALSAAVATAIGVATVVPSKDMTAQTSPNQSLSVLDHNVAQMPSTPSASADSSAASTEPPSTTSSVFTTPASTSATAPHIHASSSQSPTISRTTSSATPSTLGPTAPLTTPSTPRPTPPTNPPSSTPGAPPSEIMAREQQVLAMINQARAAHGLPPYVLLDGLNRAAAAHNLVMAGGCGLQHQCPNEPAPEDRDEAQGVKGLSGWENIGMGDPAAATRGMLAETPPNDGHLQNILNPTLKYAGIAVYWGGGNWWMTQDFSQ